MPGDGGLTSFLFVTTGSEAVEACGETGQARKTIWMVRKAQFSFLIVHWNRQKNIQSCTKQICFV